MADRVWNVDEFPRLEEWLKDWISNEVKDALTDYVQSGYIALERDGNICFFLETDDDALREVTNREDLMTLLNEWLEHMESDNTEHRERAKNMLGTMKRLVGAIEVFLAGAET